jgi:hypothetical protein
MLTAPSSNAANIIFFISSPFWLKKVVVDTVATCHISDYTFLLCHIKK